MTNVPPTPVLITGAGRGIGAAVARLVAAQGRPVLINYATSSSAAEAVASDIRARGGDATLIHADLRSETDILRMFEFAIATYGRIGGLVNNAAITGGFSRVDALQRDTLEDMLRVNVTGMILCCRQAVKHMSTKHGGAGGAIVNLSSLAARTGGAHEWVHYAASKGAVNSFTIGLAREVADEGIRVNAVAPGLIETDLHAASGQPDRPQQMAPSIPMKRPGSAEEAAAGVAWLLSDAASYTTGAILEIGGGR
ncbi:SDR family oxidoreductase [Acidobacteria bacterium AB60]|nr:SDR family oxidoreductase [Acidobacteria bacterium AB60]